MNLSIHLLLLLRLLLQKKESNELIGLNLVLNKSKKIELTFGN